MTEKVIYAAFEPELVKLPLRSLLPLWQVTNRIRSSHKYRVIAQSIDEIGIIEPLVVFHKPDQHGRRLLLDGHLKRDILIETGETETECLLATDDEAYSYNKKTIRLAIVQEHLMILRAIERGVSEERIARALHVDVKHIKRRRKMLRGIVREAVNLLRDKSVNPATFDVLRKMRDARQIEVCKLMVSTSNYSCSYAKALLAATRDEGRIGPARKGVPAVVMPADLALMEREMKDVQRSLRTTEASYGRDMLDLIIAARYVAQLLDNERIARYLEDNHPEMGREFKSIVSATLAIRSGRAAESAAHRS
jgi:ParB-like chromosome segregation protein Spo0J